MLTTVLISLWYQVHTAAPVGSWVGKGMDAGDREGCALPSLALAAAGQSGAQPSLLRLPAAASQDQFTGWIQPPGRILATPI